MREARIDVDVEGDAHAPVFVFACKDILAVRDVVIWTKGSDRVLWWVHLGSIPQRVNYGELTPGMTQVQPSVGAALEPFPQDGSVFLQAPYNYDTLLSAAGGLLEAGFFLDHGKIRKMSRAELAKDYEPPPPFRGK